MKKKFTLTAALLLGLLSIPSTSTAQDVYQLPNPDFELWEKGIKLDGTVTTFDEPVGWNSFGTATGSLVGATNHSVSKGTEDDITYAIVKSSKVLGFITANGNMTTGIVRADGPSATSEKNHNYTVSPDATDLGADNFRQKFTGYPDAMKVRLRYIPNDGKTIADKDIEKYYSQVSACIHINETFKEPYEPEADYQRKLVAKAVISPNATEAKDDWKEFIQPFEYNELAEGAPAYILLTVGTNRTPGVGTDKDQVHLDYIYMVYYSSLQGIKINELPLEGFDENTFTYNFEGKAPEISAIEAVKKGKGGIVDVMSRTTREADEVTTITITVKGDDYAINPDNVTTYNLIYTNRSVVNIEESVSDKDADVYAHNKSIFVTGYRGQVEIYTLQGIKVLNRNIEGDSSFEMPAGAYIVRTGNNSTTVIVK